MSEEIKGAIGSDGNYDIKVDDQLNVSISAGVISSAGPLMGCEMGISLKIPLFAILDAAALASKSSALISAEGFAKMLLMQYEASKPKA